MKKRKEENKDNPSPCDENGGGSEENGKENGKEGEGEKEAEESYQNRRHWMASYRISFPKLNLQRRDEDVSICESKDIFPGCFISSQKMRIYQLWYVNFARKLN